MNTLFHKCTERSDSSSWTDHDNIDVFVFRQNEGFCRRHKYTNWCFIDNYFVSHVLCCKTTTLTIVIIESNNTDGQFYQSRMSVVRGCNRIQSRLESIDEFKEFFWRVFHAELTHDVNVISGPKIVLNLFSIRKDCFDLRRWIVRW